MKNKIISLTVLIIELSTARFWLGCRDFRSLVYLSSVNTKLQLEEYIHNDTGVSFFLVRLFHNKLIGLCVNILDRYLKFWDIRFTSNTFSFIGVFGFIFFVWYLVTSKLKLIYKIIILVIIFLWPLLLIFFEIHTEFLYKFLLFIFPYYIFSTIGIWQFLERKRGWKRLIIITVLCIVSLWWFIILPKEVAYFCIK